VREATISEDLQEGREGAFQAVSGSLSTKYSEFWTADRQGNQQGAKTFVKENTFCLGQLIRSHRRKEDRLPRQKGGSEKTEKRESNNQTEDQQRIWPFLCPETQRRKRTNPWRQKRDKEGKKRDEGSTSEKRKKVVTGLLEGRKPRIKN